MDAICGQFFYGTLHSFAWERFRITARILYIMVLIKCLQRKIIALVHTFVSSLFFFLILFLMSDDCFHYLVHIYEIETNFMIS